MDFKTHSEENGTKSFKKLDEAFEYAEDQDDVESISFVLPTDEKVVLTRSLTGWEYDPFDSEALTEVDTKLLSKSMPAEPEYTSRSAEEFIAIDRLEERGLLEAKLVGGKKNYFTTNRGIRALQLHRG